MSFRSSRSYRSIVSIALQMIALVLASGWFTPAHAAITGTIRPDGNGTIGTWQSTGTAYSQINAAVTQPTAPSTASYISIGTRETGSAFFTVNTFPNVETVTGITVWVYHFDSNTGTPVSVQLYDGSETVAHTGAVSMGTKPNSAGWDSVAFSNLSLTQSQMDDLKIRLSSTGAGSGKPNTQYVYNVYGVVTYTIPPFVDIVDSGGSSVASPFYPFTATTSSFSCQTATATLGTTTQQLRFYNDSISPQWSLTIAPTGGAAAMWTNGTRQYDYNDPAGTTQGCSDGADGDAFAGQLRIDPSTGILSAKSGCTTNGVSKGAAGYFSQGTIDSITLLTSSTGQTGCYWNFQGINMMQTIPPGTYNGTYNLNFTLTATSI